jgi:predicted O-methyltransferase YrrM
LYTRTIRPRSTTPDPAFAGIEAIRTKMKNSDEEIEVLDFGAGSRKGNTPRKKISTIAKNAQKPSKFARLLYRLIRRFEPKTLFDLGTSLGLTTLYESHAAPHAQITSFEGCPETARVARENLSGRDNVQIVVGNLDETLTAALARTERLDFAFFDANHRYEPTLRYFEACLTRAHDESVFVFDDIHWSEEMEKAWTDIQAHPRVAVTIDLFFVGLVFFRQKQPRQHFVLWF